MEGEEMSADRPEGVVEGSGRRGDSRRLDQMISVRLDPTLVVALKELATDRGVSLSDILREAALLLLQRDQAQNVIRFHVQVTNERSGVTANQSFDQEIAATA
jgi:Arc/MetJ-type ribon-helix-helix transcriptional regulator